MSDVHVRIDVTAGTTADLAKALREMRERDRDFPGDDPSAQWWHKPPDNARAVLARCLSRHGLSGRLSVVEHPDDGTTPWDAIPEPVWSGFTARKAQ